MERADRDPESDHEDHDNPTFHVEERERAMFPVFPGDPFGMFIEKPFNHVMIPMRKILIPAKIHTQPAVYNNTFLFTPNFIYLFIYRKLTTFM